MEYFKPKTSSPALYVALLAVLASLTTIATIIIVIPIPATSGYLNFGDTMVMLSGLILGPLGGFIGGGFGSSLGDITLGFFQFAPITMIVKGCEGMSVGIISRRVRFRKRLTRWDVFGFLVASIIMLTGYFLAELPLYGLAAALEELFFTNIIQVTVGSIVAAIVGPIVRSFVSNYLWEPEMDEPFHEQRAMQSQS